MDDKHYWGYRINNQYSDFFDKELRTHRQLRQGWGYKPEQNLRNPVLPADDGARRNLPILNQVRKGDYLLIPHVPDWDSITIACATEDFDIGYRYEIPELGDFGHIFPAKFCKTFSKRCRYVGANLKSTLKCVSRFWNMDHCEDEIKAILDAKDAELQDDSSYSTGWEKAVQESFEEQRFAEQIYENLKRKYNASEWEFLLKEGFQMLLPKNAIVETTPNQEEVKHGCDLFIKIPGIFETTYLIAIQVKDYTNEVSTEVIDQINKVEAYVSTHKELKLIDKYVIMVRAESCDNAELIAYAEQSNVKLIFKKELMSLLSRMAKAKLNDMAMNWD